MRRWSEPLATVEHLIESLRCTDAPERLFPLAEIASALMATAGSPGSLLVVHVSILAIAHSLDGESLTEVDWAAVQSVLARLADLLESNETGILDALGLEWRDWKRSVALH